ncbi:NHL repeat-containing protein [candidate division KSB1 bacterium]|nr:NHL repeat-containing protein [candidate division KSB1 bacterium]
MLFFPFICLHGQNKTQTAVSDSFQVKFVFAFGEKGEQPGQLIQPNGLVVDPNGFIYVADTGNNRLQKFDNKGRLVSSIGGFGWDSEQFQQPMDICSGNSLDFYIADQENGRIERYDKDLNWISSIYSNQVLPENLQFVFPISLSMSIHGELFIVDSEYKRILKFNSRFEPATMFGDFDWGQGALDKPAQVFVSRNDQVFVSDQDKHCIKVYDYFGNYLYDVGQNILIAPTGICAGNENQIIVTDSGLDRVLFFDKTGRLLYQFGSEGEKYGAFNNPGDVAFLQNNLYIADTGNNRIQIFKVNVIVSK